MLQTCAPHSEACKRPPDPDNNSIHRLANAWVHSVFRPFGMRSVVQRSPESAHSILQANSDPLLFSVLLALVLPTSFSSLLSHVAVHRLCFPSALVESLHNTGWSPLRRGELIACRLGIDWTLGILWDKGKGIISFFFAWSKKKQKNQGCENLPRKATPSSVCSPQTPPARAVRQTRGSHLLQNGLFSFGCFQGRLFDTLRVKLIIEIKLEAQYPKPLLPRGTETGWFIITKSSPLWEIAWFKLRSPRWYIEFIEMLSRCRSTRL